MIYLSGFVGFVAGFFIGQMLLFFMLRGVKVEDLLNDPYFKWKYGTLNWIVAGLGAYVGTLMYERFFL